LRRIRLAHANVALYGVLALVVVVYRADLTWAAREFPAFAAGGFARPLEVSLFAQAIHNMRFGGNPERTRELLERSATIDPISQASVVLGEHYLREGDRDRALELLRRYLEHDPSSLPAYLLVAQIYREQGREEERRRMLEQGVAYFTRYTPKYRPRTDEAVERRFNQKAERVYRYYQQSLRRLRGGS
jgi:tetratricopeptide (TPR) repeat protein